MAGMYGQGLFTHTLVIIVSIIFWRYCSGATLCDNSQSESLSMCSSGQVRGTFIAINTQSYTEAVTCRCTVTVEQTGFITVATASTPSTDDCKSHMVLHIQTERLIQCTKNPTYFFQATENDSGNISFSTAYNSHGKTEYSLQLCGAKLLVVCYKGERSPPTNTTTLSTTQEPHNATGNGEPTTTTADTATEAPPTPTEKSKADVGGIVGGVLVPVILCAIVILVVVFIFRRRRLKYSDTVLRTPLPSIDKLVQGSPNGKGADPISSEANVEALYATINDAAIEDSLPNYQAPRRSSSLRYSKAPTARGLTPSANEDDNGYLQCYDALRRSNDLRYSNSPTAHAPAQEENENLTNGYLEVVK